MCCIIYKPKGVAMPNMDILGKIKKINHDGFGFVSTNHYYKGLDYRTFLRHLSEVGDDEDCIVHFRFATHGSVCKSNCHPFVKDDVYFAHNGTLPVNPIDDMTDSETAFRSTICPAIMQFGYGTRLSDLFISRICGYSRFAMMYKGEVKLYGDYKRLNGIYYSNMHWL